MTEFELASLEVQRTSLEVQQSSLALQEAALGFQEASLGFQEMSTWAAIAAVAATIVIGLLQCLLIWKGLRMMSDGSKERAAAVEQQRLADEKRHAAFMAALEQQRLADDQRHAEAMEEGGRRHAEAMAAVEQQHLADEKRHAEATAALETLIARTAPGAERESA